MANIQQYIDQFTRFVGSKTQEKARHKALLEKFISYEEQTLNDAQKLQARTNIEAAGQADIDAIYDATLDPTGFIDNNLIAVTYSIVDRTITLTKTGGIELFWRGIKKTFASPLVLSARTAGNGAFFLSSADGETFTWSTSLWDFSDIQVALALQGATYHFGLKETHGLKAWQEHRDQHNIDGTLLASGGTITAGTYAENTATDAANSPGFNAAVLRDEDLDITIAAWIEGTYTTLYIGASGEPIFSTVDTLPFRSAGSYLLVNNPTAGTNTAGVTGKYYNIYQLMLPTTADADSQKFRVVMVQPQQTFDSLAAAQAESITAINLGQLATLAPELKFYTRITYVTSASDNNTGKCRIATGGISYVVGSKNNPISVTGVLSSNHQALSNLEWTASGHTGTANKTPIFLPTGAAGLSSVQLTEAGSVNVPTGQAYQINGASLLLNHLLSGSIGAAGTIPVSAGASSAPIWTSVYGVIATTPTTGYLPKFGASKLENSLIYDNGTQIVIGGTSGSAKFNLIDAVSATFKVQSGTRSVLLNSFAGDWNYMTSLGANVIFGTQDNYAAYIYTNNLPRILISNGGNAFIGTTTLTGTIGRLTVKGSTSDNTANAQVWRNSNEVNIASLDNAGLLNTLGYAKDGTSLLLDHLKSGSLGAAGTIPVSNGSTSTPSWSSVYGAIATTPTQNYIAKFGASKLENSIIQQVGTFIGINKTPVSAFDVNGNIRANNTISFPRALDQAYTASVGTNSTTFNELLIEVTGGGSQIWFKTNGLLRHIINQDGNEFISTNTMTGTIGRVTIKGSSSDGSTNIIVGRDSNEANVYRLDTDGNGIHSGYVSATTAKLTTGATVGYFWGCTNVDGSGAWTAINQMVYPPAGIPISTGSAWGTSITDNSSNWNTAYSERRQWDGGDTNLVAATGRTSLGATTIGGNLFTLTNPSAVTFPRFNADNTVSALSAADFRTAIGANSMSTKIYWNGTQAEYDALGSYDANTIYFINE